MRKRWTANMYAICDTGASRQLEASGVLILSEREGGNKNDEIA